MIPIDTDKYPAFAKIPRLNREFWITEKLDGTNGLIQIRELEPGDYFSAGRGDYVHEDGETVVLPSSPDGTAHAIRAGSRKRWITPGDDNHGFAKWVAENAGTLVGDLGVGQHYGEWYGKGIQRNYGLDVKKFALFNSGRWHEADFTTENLQCVPVLSVATSNLSFEAHVAIEALREFGSAAVDGFPKPEGIIVFHTAANQYFKATLEGDEAPKLASAAGLVQQANASEVAPQLYIPGDDLIIPVGAI